jgi:hypothetical protein
MNCDNFFNIKFDRNSFIGFDQDEIENTTNDDLLTIKRAIYKYLKSTKLKKRNANFMEVFYRINKEIKKRKLSYKKGWVSLKKIVPCSIDLIGKTPSTTSDGSVSSENEERKIFEVIHKKYLPYPIYIQKLNVDIPNFLNDKVTNQTKNKTDMDKYSGEPEKVKVTPLPAEKMLKNVVLCKTNSFINGIYNLN